MRYIDVELIDGEPVAFDIRVVKCSAIQHAVDGGMSTERLDKLIALHLDLVNPHRIAAQKWFEFHTSVESSDKDAPGKSVVEVKSDGSRQTVELPNTYKKALSERAALELMHPWLKGLRGITAPERPSFSMTIADWKVDNIDYRKARSARYKSELSPEGTFETVVGDLIDALVEAVEPVNRIV